MPIDPMMTVWQVGEMAETLQRRRVFCWNVFAWKRALDSLRCFEHGVGDLHPVHITGAGYVACRIAEISSPRLLPEPCC
jgi:hypothetical protein